MHELGLTLRSSEVTVLLGDAQAGKTSLMRVMVGLDTPIGAHVLVDGINVVKFYCSPARAAEHPLVRMCLTIPSWRSCGGTTLYGAQHLRKRHWLP